jgi:hypothetical protein
MINDGVKMNILKILMNTEFTPFSESDYDVFGGASEHAKIGEYKDMVVVVDGTSKKPSHIEVFNKSGKSIYRGYMSEDGLDILNWHPRMSAWER